MIRMTTPGTLLLAVASSTLLYGCDRPDAEQAPANPPAAAAAATPDPMFSINELMVMIVDRPGELLWDAEKEGQAPKSAEDWYELENHAVELATAGTLIQLGGTGPNDADWVRDEDWRASAQRMSSAALAARQAAKNKDFAALVKANGEIVEACESCHKQFKPDIPTGELFMRRGPEAKS